MLKIREFQKKDLEQITKIYNHAIQNTSSVWRSALFTKIEVKQKFKNLKKDNFPILIAELEQQVVGFGMFDNFRNGDGYKQTVEHSIYVDSKHRNKKIGKQLMKKLISTAKSMNFTNMVAGIDDSNQISHLLHQSLGFQKCGTLPQIGTKFNKLLDLTFYLLKIQ